MKRTTCVEEGAPAAVSEEDDRAALLAERFAIKRRVGAGSFGVVYEAFDKHRNTLVALKHLTHLDPTSVWRFKTEFRAMADVSHPNRVVLNELFVHQGSWFFTMNLVPGVDFVRHCRRSTGESEACDLIGRLYLRWRGFRFSERAARQVAERDLARIDVCWSARIGLSLVNYVLYAAFESRHLLLALNAGEPYRIARALIAEGGFLGSSGKPLATRSSAILARGEQLAERIGDPYLIASGRMTRGANEYFLGRWRSAVEHLQCAERMFREQCHGVAWDVSAAHLFTLSALRYLGPMEDVRRQLEAHVERANHLGDLYASVTLSMHLGTLVWLAADEPARARAHLEATQRRWPYRSFQVQEWLGWSAGLDLALYEGDPGRARQLLEELEPEFKNSFLDRVQLIRVEWRYRRALVWLHVKGPERAKALRRARSETRRIRAEGLPWTRGLATLLSAALAAQQEQKQRAVVLCREACALLAAADMPLHASVARYRWSELVGGEEGVTLKARAELECRARGIRRPARWANIYCPTLLHAPDPSADRLPS